MELSVPRGDVRGAPPAARALMPMLPDTLGTRCFLRAAHALRLPRGGTTGKGGEAGAGGSTGGGEEGREGGGAAAAVSERPHGGERVLDIIGAARQVRGAAGELWGWGWVVGVGLGWGGLGFTRRAVLNAAVRSFVRSFVFRSSFA